jgi:hypothetical protein
VETDARPPSPDSRPGFFLSYKRGGHRFGIRDAKGPVARWPDLCAEWLHEIGVRK